MKVLMKPALLISRLILLRFVLCCEASNLRSLHASFSEDGVQSATSEEILLNFATVPFDNANATGRYSLHLLEGDMILSYEQAVEAYGVNQAEIWRKKDLVPAPDRTYRAACPRCGMWNWSKDYAQIPYTIDSSFKLFERKKIIANFRHLEKKTGVLRFYELKKVKGNSEYMKFTNLNQGCYADVGKQRRKHTTVNLMAALCMVDNTIQHEIMHALGFFHEMSRPDRDDYITLVPENYIPGAAIHFKKRTEKGLINSLGSAYNYNSVMQFEKDAFSKDGRPTIKTAQDGIQLGSIKGVSFRDVQQIRLMYQCDFLRREDQYNKQTCMPNCKCGAGMGPCKANNVCKRDLNTGKNMKCVRGKCR